MISFLTRIHGLVEVSHSAYDTCDNSEQHVRKIWSLGQLGGDIVMWMDTGKTHYFIDPVLDNCLKGVKAKVSFWHQMVGHSISTFILLFG